ncbi:MAG TPA: hypothetical protein DCY74_04895 [Clostridiales bacterium]|nr:hypothetical protein [Clostridiales bacterium]
MVQKKNWFLRIGLSILVITLITGCFVSGSLAKYTSSFTGDTTARVAYFNVTVGDSTGEYNLFEYSEINVDENGAGDSEYVIAPGTSGSMDIYIVNNSEVSVTIADFQITETNTDSIPIEYSTDGIAFGTLGAAVTTLATTANDIYLYESSGSVGTLYWRWIFNGDDAVDTALGLAGTAEVSLAFSCTATQVD